MRDASSGRTHKYENIFCGIALSRQRVKLFCFVPGNKCYLLDCLLALPAPAVPPPENAPIPNKKPKMYQLPLLLTSNTVMESENKEITKVNGAMNPCHRPSQKPKASPVRHSSTICTSAKQPVAATARTKRTGRI